ncbi:MAG: hypothetical protein AVDCRST_MAG30-1727 [uncultured Solirubrobacteraceae bacterium]|uniref:Uncharacterized protein n=1 Tax=uncultured Solirubrobacteraceae bacterium TaxID=1162706 RepID=A0A6J4SFN4_9ACTN|nr:MAG: hypothetical protein AVDCRST_MAG30-1727 [uncultured Solirubrobacteraceae bacterium]
MHPLVAGEEELLLRAEQAEEVRLRDPGVAGDRVGRGRGVARAGEVAGRLGDDVLPALGGAAAGGGGRPGRRHAA